jgi:signal peptidase I
MLIFPWTAFNIGDVRYDLPGEKNKVAEYCFSRNFPQDGFFPENYTICDGWLSDGDHLFVNRLTYHFKGPKRGDIVVFATEGIKQDSDGRPLTDVGFYYVKRLVGMPGDTLKISNDMLYVKAKGSYSFKPITDFGIYAFNRIFSKKGGYQGYFKVGRLAEKCEVVVPDNCYFMLGDNSTWSADSRYWGFVPKRNIVGKASFVFWPFSRRWGVADTKPPLDCPTTIGKNNYIEAMTKQ